jgi:hypothetical protein
MKAISFTAGDGLLGHSTDRAQDPLPFRRFVISMKNDWKVIFHLK